MHHLKDKGMTQYGSPICSSQRGFSLIEVLVAVLILAIGILGVAGVQLVSMQQTASSSLRTEATMYAQTAAERLRANAGEKLTQATLDALKEQLKSKLGPDSNMEIKMDGNTANIQINWVERDSYDKNGVGDKTLKMDVRLR